MTYLVLDNIRSAHNVGAIFRTADAAGVKAIYLCGITAHPPRPDIDKVALGTVEHLSWKYFEDTKEAIINLTNRGIQVVALEQTETSVGYSNFSYKNEVAIIVGNEIDGVNPEILAMCDAVVEIPMQGHAKSLNVATSAGIILFHISSFCRHLK